VRRRDVLRTIAMKHLNELESLSYDEVYQRFFDRVEAFEELDENGRRLQIEIMAFADDPPVTEKFPVIRLVVLVSNGGLSDLAPVSADTLFQRS
jgi:hypothetical protein